MLEAATLKEESNTEETFTRRQIREIYGINFRESSLFFIFRENKLSRFNCNRKIKCSDTVFLAEKKYQRRKKMGINFRELKTTIFCKNKLSRILENRIFRGIKLSRICQNSRKSRKFLPHYFLPLKYRLHALFALEFF